MQTFAPRQRGAGGRSVSSFSLVPCACMIRSTSLCSASPNAQLDPTQHEQSSPLRCSCTFGRVDADGRGGCLKCRSGITGHGANSNSRSDATPSAATIGGARRQQRYGESAASGRSRPFISIIRAATWTRWWRSPPAQQLLQSARVLRSCAHHTQRQRVHGGPFLAVTSIGTNCQR
jgi:hypothetical protein